MREPAAGWVDRRSLIASIRRAAEQLADMRPAERPVHELRAELTELRQITDVLELEIAAGAAEFAASSDYDRQGYCSAMQWLRHVCCMSAARASNAIVVGREAQELRAGVAAVRDGTIGYAHLALLARTAQHVRAANPAVAFDDETLLKRAQHHTVDRFRHDCDHARHEADAQAFLGEHLRDVESRFLEMTPRHDGSLWLRGFLDSVAATTLRVAIDPLTAPSGPEDTRTRDRRQADALVELVGSSVARGGVAAVHVTVPLATLQGLPGPAADLELAGPVPGATAQRLACDAAITRLVLDGESAVIDVGRARRVPSSATRRALAHRDRGCVWPGCERPVSWTEAHHIVHWARGGPTELSNLVLMCRRHHWLLHEGGWQIVRNPDGRVTTHPPFPDYAPRPRAPAAPAA